MSDTDNARLGIDSERNNSQTAMTTVEITPVKAPSDIKSAIRRQKRTETLDYIWHALPATRSAKPLYRAVIRGALQPGSVQCAFTDVNGHVVKASDASMRDDVVALGDDASYNQFGPGLQVTGVSINDIKFQDPSDRISPRARFGKPLHVSRYMKPNYLDQKNPNSGSRHRKADYVEEVHLERIVPLRNRSNANQTNNDSSGAFYSKTSNVFANNINNNNNNNNDNNINNISHRFAASLDERTLSPSSPSPVSANTDNALGLVKNKKLIKTDMKNGTSNNNNNYNNNNNNNNNNDKTLANLPLPTAIGTNSAVAETQRMSDSDYFVQREDSQAQNLMKSTGHIAMTTTIKKFVPAMTYSSVTKLPDTSVNDLSCIQLADSILGAVNGDLTQVYSLCKTKLRYSDFIEQSQPHRLGDTFWQGATGSKLANHFEHNDFYSEGRDASVESPQPLTTTTTTTITKSTSAAAVSSSPSSSPTTRDSTPRLPSIGGFPRPHLHLTTSTHSNNKYTSMHRKEPNRAFQTNHASINSLSLAKAGRPILKTSRSDVESSSSTAAYSYSKEKDASSPRSSCVFDRGIAATSSAVADITTSVNNSRLVRFNTCHEVREFTPSDPIRQQ